MSIIQSLREMSPDALGKVVQGGPNDFAREVIQDFINEALENEIEDFLEKALAEGERKIYRNGYYSRTVQTSFGPISLTVPRDRLSLFKTAILKPYQRSTADLEAAVQSLYLRGLSLSEVSAHLCDSLDSAESRESVRKMVVKLAGKAAEFQSRKLPRCVAVFLDGTYVPIKRTYGETSSVSKECIEVALGVTEDGRHCVLGFSAIPSEGSKSWKDFLSGLKERGIGSPKLFITDGLQGMPEAIEETFPDADRQLCLVHIQRNICKAVRKGDRAEICDGFKAVYAAPTRRECDLRFADFCSKWAKPYPRLMRSLVAKQESLFRFYEYPEPMRRSIYTSNAIESLNSVIKRASRKRIQFNSEGSALIVLVRVCEGHNNNAKQLNYLSELSEEEKERIGFKIGN